MRALLIAAALLAPGTACAATGDIGCIEEKLGQAAIDRIGDQIVAAVEKDGSLQGALDADREAVVAGRDACRKANRWSNNATDIALSFMLARAARFGSERVLVADGFVISNLVASYNALPIESRRSTAMGADPSKAVIADIKRLVSTAKNSDVEFRRRLAWHLTIFYSALQAAEFYPADFAAA